MEIRKCVTPTGTVEQAFAEVFEYHHANLKTIFEYNFPEHFGDAIRVLLEDSATGTLPVVCWTEFLKMLEFKVGVNK